MDEICCFFPAFEDRGFAILLLSLLKESAFGCFSTVYGLQFKCFWEHNRRNHKIAVQYTSSATGDGPGADTLCLIRI